MRKLAQPPRQRTTPGRTRRQLPKPVGSVIGAILLLLPVVATAQPDDAGAEPRTTPLPVVEVRSSRLDQNVLDTPGAIQILDADNTLRGGRKTQLNDALNRVPGVYASNGANFVQGLRLSIRGFGARSAYGIRGVRVRVDGIPATLVDGQSTTNAIDAAAIERIEVRRGPYSVAYGNAGGGSVNITTLAPGDGPVNRVNASAGGNGYRRYVLQSAHDSGTWGVAGTLSRLQLDGERDHSRVREDRFTGKLTHSVGTTGELELVARALNQPDTLDPGGVTRQRARRDPTAARPANLTYDARETVRQQTLGATYTDQFNATIDYRLNTFYSHREFVEFLPFGKSNNGGVPSYQRNFFGAGGKVTFGDNLWRHENQAVVGFDVQFQLDHRRRHNNDSGTQGALTQDEDQHATDLAVYAQDAFHASERMQLTAGVRYDWLTFDIDDHFVTVGNRDASGTRHYHRLSASGGINYQLAHNQHLYATIANSFQSPTFGEFANPKGSGGFNPALQPQTAVNHEIGAKGALGQRGRYQLDVFRIDVSDSIVNYASGTERDFYTNAGGSTRAGFEARGSYLLPWHLTLRAAYTQATYAFDNYRNKNGAFDGNRIPGIPEQTVFTSLGWHRPDVGYARINAHYTGSIYADNANTTRVSGYTVVDARAGKVLTDAGSRVSVYAGIKNLFDTDYYANIRINAFGGRYYEPAPGRTWYAGLRMSF